MAIRGFKSNALKRFSERRDGRKLPQKHLARIERILDALQDDDPLDTLGAPAYRMHPLKGSRKGEWSVRVSGNLRVTFRIENGNACDIDLIDYH